ncbi:hypothetical protein [Pontibacter flavimaris]|uniref:Uncharacterized protein n=1 Tax=Pontibacter flavimaris TaxID=1797110 RepID=A0A1Q5PEK3_9BACT|nr:hypothetical protein [Pontibacter flavimaris]OKL40613.1 hypothetical protein A3841_12170 [Pontibacter flavimaris]
MMKVRVAESCCRTAYKYGLGLLLFFLLGTLPGYGQVSYEASARHGQSLRKSLKDAEKVDSKYKDTHLNTNAYTFKKGEAGRKRVKKDERARLHFNVNGDPAKKLRLFKNKKKYKPRKDKRNH